MHTRWTILIGNSIVYISIVLPIVIRKRFYSSNIKIKEKREKNRIQHSIHDAIYCWCQRYFYMYKDLAVCAGIYAKK